MGDRDISLNHGQSHVVGTVIEDEVENPIFEHVEMAPRAPMGRRASHQQISMVDEMEVDDLEESDGSDSDGEDNNDSPIITIPRGHTNAVEVLRTEPKPQQQSSVGHNIVILLFVVGMVVGVVDGCVQWLVKNTAQTHFILMSTLCS